MLKKPYNILLSIYYNDHNDIIEEKKERIGIIYDPENLK